MSLQDLVRQVTQGRQVILASNRGPVEFTVRKGGSPVPTRGSGGVVSILSALAQNARMTWIASPMSDGDRLVARRSPDGHVIAEFPDEQLQLRFAVTSQDAYDKFYNVFANPLLWNLQHYMWDLAYAPIINAAIYDAWENGYVTVNRAYADAIVKEIKASNEPSLVLLHDYHLYLVAGFVREQAPNALIQHFIHIPWPTARYWLMLPNHMRTMLMEGLCQNDIIGFQTDRDALNFLYTCELLLPGVHVDRPARTLEYKGRTVLARGYPVSIDTAEVQRTAGSAQAEEYIQRFVSPEHQKTIMRVDRLEPSKNLLRGFMAYDGLLQRHPELAGRVRFLAFLVPSRTELKLYQRYTDDVFALIEEINNRHGNDAWQPIQVFYENNYLQAVAAMTQYDVLLVNSVVDGMNLVAKEGSAVNTCNGVLVLSESAGAHEQLGTYALSVAPADVEGTIRALYTALTMPEEQRAEMATRLRESVESHDLRFWLQQQLGDILELEQQTG